MRGRDSRTGRKIPVRALSIKQPWAYAIMKLGKDVENRTWWTPYRGDLVIHAPQSHDLGAPGILADILGVGVRSFDWWDAPLRAITGHIVGVVELIDVVEGRPTPSRWAEPQDRRGRPYHWLLRNPRVLPEPIRARGYQSLWQPTPADLAEIGRQLADCPAHLGAQRGEQLSLFQEARA